MLRTRLNEALKEALKARDNRASATLRLILAALKDRDIAARTRGLGEGIPEEEILQMLQSMIKQRRESINLYEQGGRLELAEQEQEEIAIIERFLPVQMDEAATREAIAVTVQELGASGIKDMGRVMTALREKFAGRMDFGKASQAVKAALS
ncbi:GatB/YqeY domain-containing protein [Haematospirillum jordaniae]|uniref:Glutamyl-tRNA amidotransferase n=1 Tax=Haematospirillum jordaniae TaxID=1549855 RepID=A0A143DBJ7_9PROT|nr:MULTISPECIES: GatB/YqeY domain-containing protein [Haematospirillum]AMW34026.1 glutamyl-tRNA amidotransferase [Haematospirillum jordaniae]NKD45346.1 GatB/YqeY domain-containing protein [Haematospirillum jordaniae]NKD57338.1 GatB/YqeY domain-containing protein [Haematospirillum jordaniae]NKD59692.1 GatB/YqeY domain-containing protein [Haematospirillum jordaniae]NKD67264.1 GatB/YqeY domain-containing protein [Haematospirillum jordaniae]